MAHVQRRGPGKYRVRYRLPDGRERSKTFTRKLDAESFLIAVSHDIRSGSYIDPAAARIPLREYAEAWRAHRPWRPATASRVQQQLTLHVYPHLGDLPVSAISPAEVRHWQATLLETLAPSTAARIQQLLSVVLREAVADQVIRANPCDRVRPPRRSQPPKVPPTPEQVQVLAAVIQPRFLAVVELGAGTGMRISEVLGLSWDRLAPEAVTVDRQLVAIRHGKAVFGPPKSDSGYRDIPIAPSTWADLCAYREQFPGADTDLVVRGARGGPCSRGGAFGEAWRKAADTAGIKGGPHELRHFYASLLIAAGRSVKEVQHRLGHASASITLDTYIHLWPDNEDGTRAAVEAALGRLRPQ